MKFDDGTYEIIGCAMKVHSALGPGLRKKPYKNALLIALQQAGIAAVPRQPYPIHFEGEVVGDCVPDITAGDVLVEIKSTPAIGDGEVLQMLNYLRISEREVGLLINFGGEKLGFQRVAPRESYYDE